uniref:ShKT domain-containing protein n=1 Tax=Meloidogyne incognita TaxID=6306 RepID=A0A914KZM5_MELIC
MTPRPRPQRCRDKDMNCALWVAHQPNRCEEDLEMLPFCRLSCRICGNNTLEFPDIEEKYDLRKTPPSLHKLAFLIGRWRSDFGGKADFPTIPKFTYGEELDFSLSTVMKMPVLNYSAFAWDNSEHNLTELHSENGFIAGSPNTSLISMNTVMSNGFVTIEEGEEKDKSIRFELQRIGRIKFSRDLPVRRMVREWILLNESHLESRLHMSTLTHRMLLHTHIIYEKVYPR